MSFSYDSSKLNETPLYQVRFRLGDTVEASAAFQDEEITFLLQQNGENVLRTCIACVEALLPRLASTTEFTVGPYSEKQGSSAFNYWSKLLDQLKGQLTGYSAPFMYPPTGDSYFYYGMMGTEASSATDP
jgi:hypothetical protein